MSYLGDAHVGEGTNVGAGTITANYDGVHKHHTEIGKGVFLGVDTMLRAPITLGDGAQDRGRAPWSRGTSRRASWPSASPPASATRGRRHRRRPPATGDAAAAADEPAADPSPPREGAS